MRRVLALAVLVAVAACTPGNGENPPPSTFTTTTQAPTSTTTSTVPGPEFPTRNSVGVPEGMLLVQQTGPVVVTEDGAEIDGADIFGGVTVRADDVTITRTRITGTGALVVSCDGCRRLVLDQVELIGGADNVAACIGRSDYTITRSSLAGCQDGAKANARVTITGSWIGDVRRVGKSHNDGVQGIGPTDVAIIGNTIEKLTCGACATSAIHLSTSPGRSSSRVEVRGNRLVSNSCVVLYLDDKGGGPISEVSVVDNVIADTWECASGNRGDWSRIDPGPGQTITGNQVIAE